MIADPFSRVSEFASPSNVLDAAERRVI
jgi:hypothetical protein